LFFFISFFLSSLLIYLDLHCLDIVYSTESDRMNRNAILACDPCGGRIEDFYKDTTHDPVICKSPKGSLKTLKAGSNFATDIDIELRSRLKAIKMEEENGEDVSGKEIERSSQLLATRLDKLHKELDSKNKIVSSYEAIKVEMDRKKEENKELKCRVFSLETATVILQQELSVMRALHKQQEKQATPVKAANSMQAVTLQDMSIDITSPVRAYMSITDCGEDAAYLGQEQGQGQDILCSGPETGTAVAGAGAEAEMMKSSLQSIFDADDILESRYTVPLLECGGRGALDADKENEENECNNRDRRREDSTPSKGTVQETDWTVAAAE
jgi:hypothetical protein